MKRWYVGIMIIFFLAVTTAVFAYGPKAGYGPGACGMAGPRAGGPANLNLSKEQQEKMWQAKEKFRNDTQKLRYEVFQKGIEMRALYTDPNADDAKILAKQKELTALRQNLQDKMVQFRLEQRKIFTPDQLKKMSETSYGPGFGRMGMGYGPRFGRGDADCGPCAGYGPAMGSGGRGAGFGPRVQ